MDTLKFLMKKGQERYFYFCSEIGNFEFCKDFDITFHHFC